MREIYARIDVLTLADDRSSFTPKSSLYMLGNAVGTTKTVEDVRVSNRKLVSKLGIAAVKEMSNDETSTKAGGDGEWEELDDQDFEDLLNGNYDGVVRMSSNTRSSSKTAEPKQVRLSELRFVSSDSMKDVQQKIAVVSGISPYELYAWCINANRSIVSLSEISIVKFWAGCSYFIEGIPVDYIANRRVATGPTTVDELLPTSSTLEFHCVSLRDLISTQRTKLSFLMQSDTTSFEIVYENFVSVFFPSLSLAAFAQLINDPDSLESMFPALAFNRTTLTKTLVYRAELLKQLLMDKNDSVQRDLVSVSATKLVVAAEFPGAVTQRVSVEDLFNGVNVNDLPYVKYIDIYRSDAHRRDIRVRKVSQRSWISNESSWRGSVRDWRKLPFVSISVLPTDFYQTMEIIIDQQGNVRIEINARPGKQVSQDGLLLEISKLADGVLSKLNQVTHAFFTRDRLPTIDGTSSIVSYSVILSSSVITFASRVSYTKLLDLFANTFIKAGIIRPLIYQSQLGRNSSNYEISYANSSNDESSLIVVTNTNGIAAVSMNNISSKNEQFHLTLMIRLIERHHETLANSISNGKLTTVDPVLFRDREVSRGYSRICQKKFQPVVASANDKRSTKYHNFTFDRPEYYRCPNKYAPYLGFLKDKHSLGHDLPCCRKTPYINPVNEKIDVADAEDRYKLYEIDYPSIHTSNDKISGRRFTLPAYVNRLLGLENAVVGGADSHRIYSKRSANEKSQSVVLMISSITNDKGNLKYKSVRDLVVDLIAMIKCPGSFADLMREKIIGKRFPTAFSLVNAIEDVFVRTTIVRRNYSILSKAEWNDLMITLINRIGGNILLLSDSRDPNKGIEIENIHQIDPTRPVLIILKRSYSDVDNYTQDTPAIYFPVIPSDYRSRTVTEVPLPPFEISNSLTKLLSMATTSSDLIFEKQFTDANCQSFAETSRSYSVVNNIDDRKLIIINVNKKPLISSVATLKITTADSPRTELIPRASIHDLVKFVENYNTYVMNDTPNLKNVLQEYRSYLKLALATNGKYDYPDLSAFILKVRDFIVVDGSVIGARVDVASSTATVATEVIFCASSSKKVVDTLIDKAHTSVLKYQQNLSASAIVTSAFAQRLTDSKTSTAFIQWDTHPLDLKAIPSCGKSLESAYHEGMYMSHIYQEFAKAVLFKWGQESPTDLIEVITSEIKRKKGLPIGQTTLERIYKIVDETLPHYDPTIVRIAVDEFAREINETEKSTKAVDEKAQTFSLFEKFAVRNVHRLSRQEIVTSITRLTKSIGREVDKYPLVEPPASNWLFHKNKLLIHKSARTALIDALVSDLTNPFRRDYVTNIVVTSSYVRGLTPREGEVIYVSRSRL